jgi:hypothetical protein
VTRPRIGRRWALAAAAVNWLAALAGCVVWAVAGAALPPRGVAIAASFILGGALGASDGIFTSLISATLQSWWPRDVPAVAAVLRCFMGLGTAALSAVAAAAPVPLQLLPLAALFALACALLLRIHVRVSGIDGGGPGAGGGANGDGEESAVGASGDSEPAREGAVGEGPAVRLLLAGGRLPWADELASAMPTTATQRAN